MSKLYDWIYTNLRDSVQYVMRHLPSFIVRFLLKALEATLDSRFVFLFFHVSLLYFKSDVDYTWRTHDECHSRL